MKTQKVIDGVYRGEVPVTPEDFQSLKDLGIKKILCLEAGWKAWFGGHMNYEIDAAEKLGIDVDNIRMSDFFAPSIEDLDTAAKIIASNHPVYVHCLHGVDRTGMAIACWRIRYFGWTWQDARDEMYRYGFHQFPYFWWVKRLEEYGKFRP